MPRRLLVLAGCFLVVLTVAVVSALAASPGTSGIAGRAVTVVCPGTPADGQTCPHRPVRATIQVLHLPSKRRVATVHSGGAGWFTVHLASGTYELTATTTSALFSATPVRTTVHAHKFARVTIIFYSHHPLPTASVAR